MRFLLLLLMWVPLAAQAQDDDKGFLTTYLQDTLTTAGRDVVITGFRGALSSEATMDKMTIADDDGIWLTLEDVILDWNRSALLRGRVQVQALTAKRLIVTRLPAAQDDALPKAEATTFQLPDPPVSVNIQKFEVDQISLGPTILGEAVVLQMTAALKLADGTADIDFQAERTDGKTGVFDIKASFDGDTTDMTLDLDLREGADGIAAQTLDLPGRPSVALTLGGSGPLDDFVSDFELATDGDPRLAGTLTLLGDDVTQARRFSADIAGDVTALFAPKYREFFGPNVALVAHGQRFADGAIDLDDFKLVAQSLSLNGQARLDTNGWPSFLDITGQVASRDGDPVLLPLGGGDTVIDGAQLTVSHDRSVSEDIRAELVLDAIQRAELSIDRQRTAFIGQIDHTATGVDGLTARIGISAQGVTLQDAATGNAVGSRIAGGFDITYSPGDPIKFTDLDIGGEDYRAIGDAEIGALEDGLKTKLNLGVVADDIARFSALAGRQLGGAVDVNVSGSVTPLGGGFDLDITGEATDLTVDQDQADRIMAGDTTLSISASRDAGGTVVDRAIITNPALNLNATAQLTSVDSAVTFDLNLKDTSLVSPDLNGPLTVAGTATGNEQGWRIDTAGSGPFGVSAQVNGLATGPNANLQYAAKLPNAAVFAPGIRGPVALDGSVRQTPQGWNVSTRVDAPLGIKAQVDGVATGPNASLQYTASIPNIGVFVSDINGPLALDGTARQTPQGWNIATRADGPAGTQAQINGLVKTNGQLDMRVTGTAPLGLANPFLAPRNLQGLGRFDLAINGAPNLNAMTGTVGTQNARFTVPTLGLSLNDIVMSARLNGGQALIDLQGAVSSGGRLRVNGPVQLGNGFDADLAIAATAIKLIDPDLYSTTASGQITIKGALARNARIAGRIEIGETQVKVPSTGITSFGELPNITHLRATRPVARTLARAGLDLKPQPATASASTSGPNYPLDITINAPARIFVRGRGLDAELGGSLRLSGTSQQVISTGRFELVRGRLDILEQRFQLDEGIIQLQGGFVPFIRFVATTETQTGTASVVISGPATSPTVSFEATPDAPEDEVLAQLLFGRDLSQVSAFQALQLASAVATLAGREGADIVGQLRRSFGLDDLDISTDAAGNTDLRVGKYIADNVYTDVTVGSDGSADVSINLDISKNVTAKGNLGSDGNTSLGIFFQKDY